MNKDKEKLEKFINHISCIYDNFSKMEKYGIEFYKISNNDTHDFYVGYRDGLFFKLSEGEEETLITCHLNFDEISDNYLGHL